MIWIGLKDDDTNKELLFWLLIIRLFGLLLWLWIKLF
jgi:hypothetical protein